MEIMGELEILDILEDLFFSLQRCQIYVRGEFKAIFRIRVTGTALRQVLPEDDDEFYSL
jgi:hypothetical protein